MYDKIIYYIYCMEIILSKIGMLLERHFGVSLEEIQAPCRRQRVTDARTVFIHIMYSHKLMNGVKLSNYLNCTNRNSYYHIRKFEDMKEIKAYSKIISKFEHEAKLEIESWRESYMPK